MIGEHVDQWTRWFASRCASSSRDSVSGTLSRVIGTSEKIKSHEGFIWQVADLLRSNYRPGAVVGQFESGRR